MLNIDQKPDLSREGAKPLLHNKDSKEVLKQKLLKEDFQRLTLSFYRYVTIENSRQLRDELYIKWSELGVLGRIYLAREGINGQLSLPKQKLSDFRDYINELFPKIPIKFAIEDNSHSFLKLTIKVKDKILADGLDNKFYDFSNVGNHLTAKQFNEAMAEPDTIVVDVRNAYESEVGHFKGALLPDVDSFNQELPVIKSMLSGQESKKILLYCTGGIRCEKTSAWLKNQGYQDVNQLHGGIIDYARQVRDEGLENKFIGKNFVFDQRLGERVSADVIAHCHICGVSADDQDNCRWQACHTLFVGCSSCRSSLQGCCSQYCLDCLTAPEAVQQDLRLKPKPPLAAKRNFRKVPPKQTTS